MNSRVPLQIDDAHPESLARHSAVEEMYVDAVVIITSSDLSQNSEPRHSLLTFSTSNLVIIKLQPICEYNLLSSTSISISARETHRGLCQNGMHFTRKIRREKSYRSINCHHGERIVHEKDGVVLLQQIQLVLIGGIEVWRNLRICNLVGPGMLQPILQH